MTLLGAHMSISGGIYNSLVEGKEIGCNTIQIFTKSNSQWRAKQLGKEEIERFYQERKKTQIDCVVAHNSYLPNLASPDKDLLRKSKESMLIELARCEELSIRYLVIHPGSHMGDGEEKGIRRIAESVNWIFDRTLECKVKIVLETTAGQGSSIGYRFEHIAGIVDWIDNKERVGVCFDTCHAFAAGYDIRDNQSYEETWEKFEQILGMRNLLVMHINDSKKPLGSRIDRHEHIGRGEIGLSGFKLFMNDERWRKIPKIVETPKKGNGLELDRINIETLKSLVGKRPKKRV